MRRSRLPGVLVLLAVLAAGCGPATTPSASAPAATTGVAIAALSFTGGITGVTSGFTTESCAVRAGTLTDAVNTTLHSVPYRITIRIAQYAGPGTYSLSDPVSGPQVFVAPIGAGGSMQEYLSTSGSGYVTVSPGDRAGTLEADLIPASVDGVGQPAHVIGSWTCGPSAA